MFYYFVIFMAVVCFTGQFVFTKCYQKAVAPSMISSLIMVTVMALAGSFLCFAVGGFRLSISPISLFWAALLAASILPYNVIGIKVLTLGSLAIYSMFMMLGGMLVPFFYGLLFLGETPTVGRIAGSILLSLFMILQSLWASPPQASVKGKKWLFLLLTMINFFINGFSGVIAKEHATDPRAVDALSFTALSALLTAVFSILFLLFYLKKSNLPAFAAPFRVKPLISMLLLGFISYTGTSLHLVAASHVPASVQFPLVSGGVIVLSAFAAALFFREKISKREWICLAGAFLSTVLFAF